jgi:serine/threonine protein kinase
MARSLKEGETIRVCTPLTVLGSGAFGTVCAAEFRESGEGPWHPCALKLISAVDAAAVDGELDALAALPPHPNIVRLIGKTRSATKVGIATELLAGGSLHKRLEEATRLNKPPSTETRLRWCMGVAAGLAEMHSHGLVHGDIKTHNVMMDSKGAAAGTKLIVREHEAHVRRVPGYCLAHLNRSLHTCAVGLWAGQGSAWQPVRGWLCRHAQLQCPRAYP